MNSDMRWKRAPRACSACAIRSTERLSPNSMFQMMSGLRRSRSVAYSGSMPATNPAPRSTWNASGAPVRSGDASSTSTPGRRQSLHRPSAGIANLCGDRRHAQVGAVGDPQRQRRRGCRVGEGTSRRLQRQRVACVEAGHRVQHQRRIGHRASHRPLHRHRLERQRRGAGGHPAGAGPDTRRRRRSRPGCARCRRGRIRSPATPGRWPGRLPSHPTSHRRCGRCPTGCGSRRTPR